MTGHEQTEPAVMDYEGSEYRTDFWEDQGRNYEDLTERIALRRLLPSSGQRLLELGAGFGRLTDEYHRYKQIVLVDYSTTLLAEAQARLGRGEQYLYVAANIYNLPINAGTCDAAAMVRVIHHFEDVPTALKQVRATLAPNSPFILEFANKRNLKAILRYALRRQDWNPFDKQPVEFVRLNFDFHPRYMTQALQDAGFETKRKLALSYLRLGILKRMLPVSFLVALDRLLQPTAALVALSPSVFTANTAVGDEPPTNLTGPLFKCPSCGQAALVEHEDRMVCGNCDTAWAKQDGIYNFKEPLSA
jgi:SAM-dependent methyltransferase